MFQDLVKEIAELVAENKPADMEAAMKIKTDKGTIESDLIEATQVIGEKISFRRFEVVEKTTMLHLVDTCIWADVLPY